ncbi:metal ABC transporter solute-binding protein, Zn/Mn family [Curtobacterium sp. Leaf261]|uniref:metal ABC transporter solute-binding protein, Zn/Mn family n=1 Tax=Curtobacterium sp. Leaf261 TaxID=1736311 RepID=UPI0006F85F6B|nr:zinc ABC transporter substrate-binding protein [Curtobacterium sp. Leaf261]KQO61310.1 ABC transporter substrate-binding protein [Curtobacterium sp. Leaf261]
MRTRSLLAVPLIVGAAAMALSGCSTSSATGGSGSGSSDGGGGGGGAIRVVASTNVYGGIVKTIGGAHVDVTSILDDPSQDPHSFEADARTQLAVSKADIVIENGGGYDPYIDTLMKSTGSDADLVNVVKLSGLQKAGDDEFNEHVFYSYPTMTQFVARIQAELTQRDTADGATFATNATKLTAQLQKLESSTSSLAEQYKGDRVSYTEPVPGYLFDAIGLDNVTPEAFSEAIEEGDDVPPAALNQTLNLFSGSDPVTLLAYNDQTSSPETEKVQRAAESAGVPVVGVTETLPKGEDYISWQQKNIARISAALAK